LKLKRNDTLGHEVTPRIVLGVMLNGEEVVVFLSRILEKVSRGIIGVLLIVLATNVLLQILSRQILKLPLVWTDEVARFSFIWLALIGASLQVKYKAHFAVTFITDKFKNKKIIHLFVYGCMLIIALALLILGYKYSLMGFEKVSAAMNIKMVWIYSAIPAGSLLMVLYLIEAILIELQILDKVDNS
jgi:TRAP-type transport system small permease protein